MYQASVTTVMILLLMCALADAALLPNSQPGKEESTMTSACWVTVVPAAKCRSTINDQRSNNIKPVSSVSIGRPQV